MVIYSGFTDEKWWFSHSYVKLPEGNMQLDKILAQKNSPWHFIRTASSLAMQQEPIKIEGTDSIYVWPI